MRASIVFFVFAFGCHHTNSDNNSSFNHHDGGADDGGRGNGDGSTRPGADGGGDGSVDTMDGGSNAGDGSMTAYDLGPPTGKFIWEIHGPMGPGAAGTFALPVQMVYANGNIVGAFGSNESDSFGPLSWTVPTGSSSLMTFSMNEAATKGVTNVQPFAYGIDERPNLSFQQQMAVDSAGDIYNCTGFFDPTVSVTTVNGTVVLNNYNSNGMHNSADILYKVQGSTGKILWATSFTVAKGSSMYGTLSSACMDVATQGTTLVAAYRFAGSVAYPKSGAGTVEVDTGSGGAADTDGLVVGIDAVTGDVTWARHLGGEADDHPVAVAVEPNNNIWVGATTQSKNFTIDGAATTLGNPYSGSNAPIFIELDASTHAVGFTKSFTAQNAILLWRSFAFAPNGDTLACGSGGGAYDFGTGPLVSQGEDDIIVVRYNKTSGAKYALEIGGSANDECNTIAVDSTDEAVIGVGYESFGMTFGTHKFANPDLNYAGSVVKLSSTGTYLWSQDLVGMAANVWSVDILPDHEVIYAGGFTGSLDLGDGPMNGGDGTSTASYFIVRRSY